MADIENYLKELSRCSKCGLCNVNCPVYQESLNDCDGARGKIVMLQGILEKKLKVNDKVLSYFKKCDGCDLCIKSCPAGIKIKELFEWFSKCSFKI